ncbi:MAG: TrkA family potassium uptake protein [Spirochaetes bacterium]|nr:TrkA family potassium uptake protein [Spirochaetota bacterium]
MQRFAVIGLGSYGIHVAKSLKEYGSDVTGIDINHEHLLVAHDYLNHSVTGDATDRSFLQTLSLRDLDAVMVCLSTDVSANTLIVMLLKEMGVKRIIARAITENHRKVLEQLGTADIVFPERDSARHMGKALAMRNVLDSVPLTGEYVVMNIQPPRSFIGRSIRELQIGARFQCQILGIKYLEGNDLWNPDSPEWENMKIAPVADEVIPEHSVLMFLGKKSNLMKIQQLP